MFYSQNSISIYAFISIFGRCQKFTMWCIFYNGKVILTSYDAKKERKKPNRKLVRRLSVWLFVPTWIVWFPPLFMSTLSPLHIGQITYTDPSLTQARNCFFLSHTAMAASLLLQWGGGWHNRGSGRVSRRGKGRRSEQRGGGEWWEENEQLGGSPHAVAVFSGRD